MCSLECQQPLTDSLLCFVEHPGVSEDLLMHRSYQSLTTDRWLRSRNGMILGVLSTVLCPQASLPVFKSQHYCFIWGRSGEAVSGCYTPLLKHNFHSEAVASGPIWGGGKLMTIESSLHCPLRRFQQCRVGWGTPLALTK